MEDVRIRASDQEYPSQCRRKSSLTSNAITFPDIIVFWQRRYSEVFTTSTNSKECWREGGVRTKGSWEVFLRMTGLLLSPGCRTEEAPENN
jgi:hypothetical protein